MALPLSQNPDLMPANDGCSYGPPQLCSISGTAHSVQTKQSMQPKPRKSTASPSDQSRIFEKNTSTPFWHLRLRDSGVVKPSGYSWPILGCRLSAFQPRRARIARRGSLSRKPARMQWCRQMRVSQNQGHLVWPQNNRMPIIRTLNRSPNFWKLADGTRGGLKGTTLVWVSAAEPRCLLHLPSASVLPSGQ